MYYSPRMMDMMPTCRTSGYTTTGELSVELRSNKNNAPLRLHLVCVLCMQVSIINIVVDTYTMYIHYIYLS